MADKPVTREEKYLAYLTGDYTGELPKPITRKEKYLYELCLKGMGGEISPEEIKNAVNEYLEKNPVKPGATTEQAQQIEQNKTDIGLLKEETGSLKEDLSNKITKFYATNNGENYLADSDDGKIQDMQIFGRSEQKKYNGYHLIPLAPIDKVTGEKLNLPYTENGITVDIANDGIGYTVSGTNTLNEQESDIYLSIPNAFDIEAGTYTRSGKIINGNNNVELISGGGISNGGCLEYKANKENFTFTETVKKGKSGNFVIRISPSATVNAIVYFQIEKGSEAHAYEPYTGGQPSPSPDYPQEIKSVVNPTIKLLGSNILKIMDGEYQRGGVTAIASNGVIKLKGTVKTETSIFFTGSIVFKEGTKIIFSPNKANGMEEPNNVYLGFTNNVSIGFSIRNNNINTPYIIKKEDANHPFNLFIKILAGTNLDETWRPQVLIGETITAFKPYTEQTIILPITLNAIPVSSGGNVTINEQQYVADYVDVERGKLVKMVDSSKLDNTQSIIDKTEWLLAEPQETDLTTEQITAFKALATYYPTTNIFINSEQLDGYTVFNYPISMKNGWDYVKKQLNDNRDYIYNMDTKTQDIDTQAAEAYVNSEYAVALTELEV